LKFTMVPFNAEKIKISQIFKNRACESFADTPVFSEKIKKVYGYDISFPKAPADRPYIFSSFVTSIDGKLAYADKPSAFYVAGKNQMAGEGKNTDFWILNALRGICDAAIIGGNSMETDADYAMYCMDEDIQRDRRKAGLSPIPLNIIMTLDASDVPLDHKLLKSREVPSILCTSPEGCSFLREHYEGEMIEVSGKEEPGQIHEVLSKAGKGVLPVLVTGEGKFPDSKLIMKILRGFGIRHLLIESPGYGHYLVKQEMMDEFFLNMSAVYIGGGDTMTLGKADKGFSAEAHPHTEILSIHMFNEYFVYFRYRFHYEFM